jgi:hypothetical protein
MRGRPEKAYSEKLETKLLDILQKNYDALFGRASVYRRPLNVRGILVKLKEKGISIDRRGLNKRLSKYYQDGMLEKKQIGKEVYYYYKDMNPKIFWEKTVKPFIDEMKIETGSWARGYTTIHSTKTHFYMLGDKAVILEDGLDITSKLEWEDYPSDVIGKILHRLENIIIEEMLLRLKRNEKKTYTQQEAIDFLKGYFENKKLAFVYVLDGSEFEALDKEEIKARTRSLISKPKNTKTV